MPIYSIKVNTNKSWTCHVPMTCYQTEPQEAVSRGFPDSSLTLVQLEQHATPVRTNIKSPYVCLVNKHGGGGGGGDSTDTKRRPGCALSYEATLWTMTAIVSSVLPRWPSCVWFPLEIHINHAQCATKRKWKGKRGEGRTDQVIAVNGQVDPDERGRWTKTMPELPTKIIASDLLNFFMKMSETMMEVNHCSVDLSRRPKTLMYEIEINMFVELNLYVR